MYVGAPLSNSSGNGLGAVFYCTTTLLDNKTKIIKVEYADKGEFFSIIGLFLVIKFDQTSSKLQANFKQFKKVLHQLCDTIGKHKFCFS